MLTRKQHELLMFIHEHLKRTGISPSFDEMKEAVQLKSKSGIHRLITGLEERGFIRRLPHRARALEVVKLPEETAPGRGRQRFTPNVIEGRFPMGGLTPSGIPQTAPPATAGAGGGATVTLPLYGRIAAGTPIEALRDPTRTLEVPAGLVGRGEYYALEVAGESMIDAGIHEGDTVIIERCDAAENGAIVVALVDDQEATLKRIRRKGHSVALEAANPAYETRIFGPDRVRVQGRLVGLYRRY